MHSLRILLALVVCSAPATSLAGPDSEPSETRLVPRAIVRVRPADSRMASLLLAGRERSPTLRALIDQLEARSVIVYIESQPALRGRLAGTLTYLTTTRRFRYVRISLNPEVAGDRAIATLGHELQHALEVADAPSIVDDASLEAYYRAHGIHVKGHDSGWDSEAARDAGDEVRRELAVNRTARALESV